MRAAALAAEPAGIPGASDVRLCLIDGSAFIFRAYFGWPGVTRASDGLAVGAVLGFCHHLWDLLDRLRLGPAAPTHLAVVFDRPEKTFRHHLYPAYKAHRPPAPADLIPQFDLVRQATAAFGLAGLELAGYEADDLIAAYATHVRDAGGRVTIVSQDKDLMQLVCERVSMLDTFRHGWIGHDHVVSKFGVPPGRVVDVQALCGDAADNVPGAPGIGVKTAALLINHYGDLETVLARAGEVRQAGRRRSLTDFAHQIRLSRQLVQLDCAAPRPLPLDALALAPRDAAPLGAFLEAMEFRALSRRMDAWW
jgi:DNA polymerase-1